MIWAAVRQAFTPGQNAVALRPDDTIAIAAAPGGFDMVAVQSTG